MSLESAAISALAAYTTETGDDPAPFFAIAGGAADYIAAIEADPDLPAAFVLLGDIENGEQRLATARQQSQTEWLDVWIAVGKTVDARGATAAIDARAAITAVDDALLALRVDGYHPLEKRGCKNLGFDYNGLLWRVAYYSAMTYTDLRT